MTRKRQPQVSEVNLCIRRTVKQNPGIHFRGLGRAARVTSAGQLRHHLDHLEREGILVELNDGRYKRFFVAGDQDPKIRPEMARFTRVVPRRIAKLLLLNPMNRSQLRRSLGCADSTLGYHLTRMVEAGDLVRARGPNSCVYSLASGDTVRKLLLLQGAAAALEWRADASPHGSAGRRSPPRPGPAPRPAMPDPLPVTPNPLPAAPDPLPGMPDPLPDLPGVPDLPDLPAPPDLPDALADGDLGMRSDPTF